MCPSKHRGYKQWKFQEFLPDTVTRSTSDTCDGDLRISLSNRDAVITRTNMWSRKVDTRASLNVNAISVRTVCWGWNLDFTTFEVLALHESNVKELAIQRSYASYNCLIHSHEFHILQREIFFLIKLIALLSQLPILCTATTKCNLLMWPKAPDLTGN